MADPQHGPFPLSYVLSRELQELRPAGRPGAGAVAALPADLATDSENRDVEAARRTAVYRAAHQADLSALCLSGGGIRSASFSLGVMQALAEGGLLKGFDYLSTVSGGGYIGAWLSAWLQRASDKAYVLKALSSRRVAQGFPFPGANPDPAREPAPIEHLREYSNYLTAKTGLLSADTWAAIAIVLRNIVLNWLILLPAIALVVIAFKFIAAVVHNLSGVSPVDLIIVALALFGAVSLAYKLAHLYWATSSLDPNRAQRGFLLVSLLPAAAAGVCLAALAIGAQNSTDPFALMFSGSPPLPGFSSWVRLAAFSVVVLLLAVIFANAAATSLPTPTTPDEIYWHAARRRWIKWQALSWLASAIVFGSAIWLGTYLARSLQPLVVLDQGLCVIQSVPCAAGAKPVMAMLPIQVEKEIVLIIFGVPWFLLSASLAHAAYLLFCSYSPWGDVEREWLGRASGWYFIAGLVWIALAGVILLGPKLYFGSAVIVANAGAWLTALTGASGAATAWIGKTGLTPAQGSAKGAIAVSLNVALGIAATIFAVLLLILLSAWSDEVFLHLINSGGAGRACFSVGSGVPPACWHAWAWLRFAAVLVGIAAVGGFFVNVNRFSLHAIYRNRLIRAYLGASRAADPDRKPDPFTGFDWDDNLRVTDLWSGPATPDAPWRPFHVINMTLNLAASRDLAWQQRKAMSFAATPLFSGASSLGYRRSEEYGDPGQGITLGTAMAISGAAVSSSMGYHSSPGIAFLLTLFDVRLGWWLGNPGPAGDRPAMWPRPRAPYTLDAPRFAIRPLLSELFGLMNEDSPYVYLSDGGHFEDLGIYEMVRRRCSWIVAIDAGADPKRGFEDLGNAVRKIWIDLGVRITFSESVLLAAATDAKPADVPYFALGQIEYEGDRDGDAAPPTGRILYIKAAVRGDEAAADVIAYQRANPAFPNQSTLDQWFDEPQLEAYRVLAYLIVKNLIKAAKEQLPEGADLSLDEFFSRLDKLDARTLKPPASPETT